MLKLMRIQWNTMGAVQNTILIEAGEEGSELFKVYSGNITFAKIDMANAPNVSLNIESSICNRRFIAPVQSKIFEANTDAAAMIEDICKDMGYRFENNGASKIIADGGTYNGTRINMIKSIADAADFDLYIEQTILLSARKAVHAKSLYQLFHQRLVLSATQFLMFAVCHSKLFMIHSFDLADWLKSEIVF